MTETKLVAFVDILGFSQMIEGYDNGNEQILHDLIDAMSRASSYIGKNSTFLPQENNVFFNFKECLEVKLFSDCLCVSVPLEFGNQYNSYNIYDQFWFLYQYLAGYQILLMQKGIFTRGAITIGSYYSDDNIIFSGGLVEAYNLESKIANYPRIILSEKLINFLRDFEGANNWDFRNILNIDNTGLPYINPFNYNISTSEMVDKALEEMIAKTGIQGVFDETFLDKDLRAKNEELNMILEICNTKISSINNAKAQEKYQWFSDFINYELEVNNKRDFNIFNFS